VLDFLYTAVSWVLLRWHQLFSAIGLDKAGGLNWALSIIFLVITARLVLFRLFVKQVKYQRHMQAMQPRLQKIREKYKDDRAAMQREMMKLQQEEGFNPLAGCLPLFLQFPIFIALYHVLRHIANTGAAVGAGTSVPDRYLTLYSFTKEQTLDAASARLFGGAPLAGSLRDSNALLQALQGTRGILIGTILVLVLISASATYMTQRLARAGMLTQPEGTAATMQRLMLYAIPLFTLGSGLFFPLGVLLYWFASNTWTMFQQLYINKYHPQKAPEPAAERALSSEGLKPPPGAKPIRGARGATSLTKSPPPAQDPGADGDDPSPGADSVSLPRGAARPGQRPARPAGKRPPGKRPSQAKKRR
jgi:YidC/Oxa1 family membrane protein insertase